MRWTVMNSVEQWKAIQGAGINGKRESKGEKIAG